MTTNKTPAQLARDNARKMLAKGITVASIAQAQLLIEKWNALIGVPKSHMSDNGFSVCLYMPKGETWIRHAVPVGSGKIKDFIKNASTWMTSQPDAVAKIRAEALVAHAAGAEAVDGSWN